MALTNNVVKTQKVEECMHIMLESVMFNSDALFKIASYLPVEGLLNLALTCRRFGVAPLPESNDDDDSLSLVEETARRIVHDIATEEQMSALPGYDGDNWLCKYNYLLSLKEPLQFDQLVGQQIEYVLGNKSRVQGPSDTAFSNNIMMAGKHYVSFECRWASLFVGVMRPGEAMQNASYSPLSPLFYEHFTQRKGSRQYNNSENCCMYDSSDGHCWSSDWEYRRFGPIPGGEAWEGMEGLSDSPSKIGMLLDLDEGTLSVYIDERKLGVMKRGLAGHYCWAVSLSVGSQVSIKRGPVPES